MRFGIRRRNGRNRREIIKLVFLKWRRNCSFLWRKILKFKKELRNLGKITTIKHLFMRYYNNKIDS